MKTELTYQLSGDWGNFFDAVQDYCRELAENAERAGVAGGTGLMWYATLALLRCVASSPAAAVKALTTRLQGSQTDEDLLTDESLHDGEADDLSSSDLEPAGCVQDGARLSELIKTAQRLSGQEGDPKLAVLTQHVGQLLKDGYHPVVFCRYIATAHYIGRTAQSKVPQCHHRGHHRRAHA